MNPSVLDKSSSVKSLSLGEGTTDAVVVGTLEPSAKVSKIWTRSAKLFIASVSLFVVFTTALLVALEVLNIWITYSNHMLLPQSIVSEFVLLIAAIFAVRSKNMVQICSVVLFNIFLVISGFIEAQQQHGRLVQSIADYAYYTSVGHPYEKAMTRARLALIWTLPFADLLFHMGCDWSAWMLYRELGWDAYKRVSGDLHLGKLYSNYQLLCSSLLFSLYFSVVQTWSFCLITTTTASWLTYGVVMPFFVPFLVAWTIYVLGISLAFWAVKKERRWTLRVSMVLQVLWLAWSLWTIIQFGIHEMSENMTNAEYLPGKALFQFIVGFPLAIFTLVYSYIVGRSFGEGLKAVHFNPIVLDPEKVELSLD